jgi:hypothetical protein
VDAASARHPARVPARQAAALQIRPAKIRTISKFILKSDSFKVPERYSRPGTFMRYAEHQISD